MNERYFIEKRLGLSVPALIALSFVVSLGVGAWFLYDYTGWLKTTDHVQEQARLNDSIAAAQAKADLRAAQVAELRKHPAR